MARGRSEVATDGDVLDAARDISEPIFGAAEVAARLPIGAERTRAKLDELVEKDVLGKKQIGNANAYWLVGY